jgi:predicted RNase H-like nuclease (RuvC/YqgF family)
MAGKVWPDPSTYSQRIELSDADEDDGVVTFANATATALAEATRQQDRQRQQEESQQYELLASKVKSLVTKVTQLKQENTAAKTDLRVAVDLNKELKLKVETLQEQQEVSIVHSRRFNPFFFVSAELP